MLGTIIGDLVGSKYENLLFRPKKIKIFDKRNRMTDDSLLTLEVIKVLINNYPILFDQNSLNKIQDDLINAFSICGQNNPDAGFGEMFLKWCYSKNKSPYNSFGNGSAMRISPIAYLAKSLDEVKILSRIVSEITHNHPLGIKGAEAISVSIYLTLNGYKKDYIKNYVVSHYYPNIDTFSYKDLLGTINYSTTCEETVPRAIYTFLISKNFKDSIIKAVSLGGDTDTIAAMNGGIAEAYYNKDKLINFQKRFINNFIPNDVLTFLINFYSLVGSMKFLNQNLFY